MRDGRSAAVTDRVLGRRAWLAMSNRVQTSWDLGAIALDDVEAMVEAIICGWNGPDAPSFVAPVAAEVGCAVVGDGFARLERFDMPPLSLVVFEVSVETQ